MRRQQTTQGQLIHAKTSCNFADASITANELPAMTMAAAAPPAERRRCGGALRLLAKEGEMPSSSMGPPPRAQRVREWSCASSASGLAESILWKAARSRAMPALTAICMAVLSLSPVSIHTLMLASCSADVMTRHASHVTRHRSQVTRHTSHVTRHTSHVTRHTSHVTHHTLHVTRHTLHVTRHTSHVTHHLQRMYRIRYVFLQRVHQTRAPQQLQPSLQCSIPTPTPSF